MCVGEWIYLGHEIFDQCSEPAAIGGGQWLGLRVHDVVDQPQDVPAGERPPAKRSQLIPLKGGSYFFFFWINNRRL